MAKFIAILFFSWTLSLELFAARCGGTPDTEVIPEGPAAVSNVTRYRNEISGLKFLSAEQEQILGAKGKNKSTAERDALFKSNLSTVMRIAREYLDTSHSRYLDLVQEGNLGLMQAAQHFEAGHGARFIAFADPFIRGYMKSYMARNRSIVQNRIHSSKGNKKLYHHLYRQRGIEGFLGEKNLSEVANEFGRSVDAVREIAHHIALTDQSIDFLLAEKVPLPELTVYDSLSPKVVQNQLLYQAIEQANLKPRERFIIENRLLADEPMGLKELGIEFKVSTERARQIEVAAIKKLRTELERMNALDYLDEL